MNLSYSASQHKNDSRLKDDVLRKNMNQLLNIEEYIYQSFQTHQVIGLGEGGHNLINAHQCIAKILMNEKIIDILDVIILEFLNAKYQNILDKFMLGENVSVSELQKLWRDSSQSPGLFGEASIYLELLKTLRQINIRLPQAKKIRVLAGDPPIDWDKIHTINDYNQQLSYGELRHSFPVELIKEFAINQKKRILVIYSEFHITKIADHRSSTPYSTITERVNQVSPEIMKSIAMIYSSELLEQERILDLDNYSVIELQDDKIGKLPASIYWNSNDILQDGQKINIFDNYKLLDIFDALIYLGSRRSLQWSNPNTDNFDDQALQELNRRKNLA